jgi:hypothetical protein
MSRRLPRFPETHERHLVENESIEPETMAPIVPDIGVVQNPPIGRRKGEAAGAAAVAKHAKAELESITGLDADHVSAVLHQPDGWHVTVDLVENESIEPATMASIVPDMGVEQEPPIGRRKGEAAGAAAVAKHAKTELESITGLDADHVSAVLHQPDGWHVTVDLVELRRIPAATDVLASYEAVLGPTGILLSYHRTRRYFRDQMLEQS